MRGRRLNIIALGFFFLLPVHGVFVRLPVVYVWSTAHQCGLRVPYTWSSPPLRGMCYPCAFNLLLFLFYFTRGYSLYNQSVFIFVDCVLPLLSPSSYSFEHSHPFCRPRCSTTGPNGRRVQSRAPLVHGWCLAGRMWWMRWLAPLVLFSIAPWLAAAQVAPAPCAPGSAPSGPGGACVVCQAGSFCPDGRTLPLPCPPGSVTFSFSFFYVRFV
jgi:hypothetical protein